MKNKKLRVVMLCGKGLSSRVMYNALASHVNIECVILENKTSARQIIERRMKKIGISRTIGQLLFSKFNKILARASQIRIKQLLYEYSLDDSDFQSDILKRVESVNSEKVIRLLTELVPDAIVVNGTKIITASVLSSINAPFFNTHMGITPKYRGVHGGYWALANEDLANCGVTVHLVDQGIDTGDVVYQDTIYPDRSDNLNTYPIHQIAKAIPLMKAALDDLAKDRLKVKQGVLPSKLWYHPTLLEYAKNWVLRGVR